MHVFEYYCLQIPTLIYKTQVFVYQWVATDFYITQFIENLMYIINVELTKEIFLIVFEIQAKPEKEYLSLPPPPSARLQPSGAFSMFIWIP